MALEEKVHQNAATIFKLWLRTATEATPGTEREKPFLVF